MASSPVDICNIALTVHLGANSISSFNDPGKEALLARTAYNETRNEVLRAHPWNCATKRAALVANATAPEWGFDFAYPQPNDCLRILEVLDETGSSGAYRLGYDWQLEDGEIVTDLSSPLNIRYIFENTVVETYDAEFVKALSYKLASEWVEPLVKAANLKGEMVEFYKQVLASARATDGQEGSPRKLESFSWLTVR
jgi:hypothetical protein